jgi:hypothetical protein
VPGVEFFDPAAENAGKPLTARSFIAAPGPGRGRSRQPISAVFAPSAGLGASAVPIQSPDLAAPIPLGPKR